MEANVCSACEYRHVTANRDMENLWWDGMASFGWIEDGDHSGVAENGGEPGEKVELTFRRERSIAHKRELDHLQEKFERCMQAISVLESSEGRVASLAAILIGLVGTGFLGFAAFAYLAEMSPVFWIAAVPGLGGWILSYFLYRALRAVWAQAIAPDIERQYSKIYALCQEANAFLVE